MQKLQLLHYDFNIPYYKFTIDSTRLKFYSRFFHFHILTAFPVIFLSVFVVWNVAFFPETLKYLMDLSKAKNIDQKSRERFNYNKYGVPECSTDFPSLKGVS